jgi:hypothetical protein
MGAFADYIDLRLAVSEHVSNRNISDVLNRLTLSAESMLNSKVRHRKMLTDAALVFTAGRATLPTDFLEMELLQDAHGVRLKQTDLTRFKQYGSGDDWYAVDDGDVLANSRGDTLNCTYYAALPTLTTSFTTSNWLLARYPDVYLYAVGLEAAKFLRDAELASATGGLLKAAMLEMKIDDDRARFGDAVVNIEGYTP